MSNSLFKDFDAVSAKQWKQKIQVDLKGADYNDTLIWQSPEGIHVKPFYHQDELKSPFPPIPGHPESWRIAQSIFIDDETIANKLALDAIDRGAEAIWFTSEKEFDMKVFSNFPFETTPIYIDLQFLSEAFNQQLKHFLETKKATFFWAPDPIAHLASDGNWFHSLQEDHAQLNAFHSSTTRPLQISIDTTTYQNSGANMVQQLAYALAHANEYLNHFASEEKNKTIQTTFKVAIGGNYFFEIAKIRALRRIYAILAAEYNCVETCHILATPSKRNKTLYDYNVNMLRTTTECMSAVLGGADTVCNIPYDALYHKSNEFGERISRNQLLILKKESYFDTVSNPSDGSYYIESITEELAEKALELFKDIEKNGGFLSQLKEGTIQRKIKDSAEKEQELFDAGEVKLLGTNYHPNPQDSMNNDLELYPFVKTKPRKTLLEPIIEKRLSEKLEQERLKAETL
ncbi:methylmalonyl-CoA mutase subunit beta [Cochleicola gelatinilyticus]|uniref:Methylmalonyl-CoA mutase n=1 Tax=Cochleicola gelatinilyticus TaxID=1763537 RepID=A0A167KAQ1_9FLAO|nr:methylmalonyl-CoA mutase subunit beta [Cochleicola gelatinilyticus]OAB81571.1 methylmalonyl-CoA mutase [Cochleicola gelatinilyticus]